MKSLEGKVALVTGAGRGIGEAIALKLAGEGAKIVVNDLDVEPAEATAKMINDAGGEAMACAGDVVKPDLCEKLVATAVDGFGGLDIIVNNAGYTWDNVIQKMSDEQWRAILDVHLTAPFQILRAAAGFIRSAARQEKEEGREVFRKVVNISSISGLYGNAGQANYSSAKAGIVGMTRAMSKEWGRYKVNVNCVAFGMIDTRLTEATEEKKTVMVEGKEVSVGIPPKVKAGFAKMVPMGRAGSDEEAAGAVYLMCCPESNYVSGQTLICGGGLSF